MGAGCAKVTNTELDVIWWKTENVMEFKNACLRGRKCFSAWKGPPNRGPTTQQQSGGSSWCSLAARPSTQAESQTRGPASEQEMMLRAGA